MMLSRRTVLLSLAGGYAISGCSFYREPPPVVVGGNPVAKDQPIMAALRASSEHGRFVEALEAAGLDEQLDSIGPFTVFAPTDAALAGLRPKADKAKIESNPDFLKQVLLGHIVPARVTTEDLLEAFPQLNGKTKVFSVNKQVIVAEGEPKSPKLFDLRERRVNVLRGNALAANGILHVVDGVLLPKAEKSDET